MRRLALLVLALSTSFASAAEPDLQVAIALHDDGLAQLQVGAGRHFHVVVTNVSTHVVRLWGPEYSWGYYTLAFEAQGRDGKVVRIEKSGRGWDENIPLTFELQPGARGSSTSTCSRQSGNGRSRWRRFHFRTHTPTSHSQLSSRSRPTWIRSACTYGRARCARA